MGEVIGLDYGAMYRVAETLEIEMTPVLLRKIRALENRVLERLREQAEEKTSGGAA